MFHSVLLCLCLVTANSTRSQELQAKQAQDAIARVLSDQVEAWNKGDLKGFMIGYLRSGETTFYSGSNVLKGWDAVMERYQKQYQGEGKEMGKLTFRDLNIEMLGADTAYVRGRFELVRSADKPSGLFTLILRKTADGWRIVHDHTSQ